MNTSVAIAIVGIALGFLAAKLLFLQFFTLIPWGIAASFIGYLSKSKAEAIKSGALYGFCLGFVFMAAVYGGSAPIVTRIPFFALMGIVSAICAMLLSTIGFFSKRFIKRKN